MTNPRGAGVTCAALAARWERERRQPRSRGVRGAAAVLVVVLTAAAGCARAPAGEDAGGAAPTATGSDVPAQDPSGSGQAATPCPAGPAVRVAESGRHLLATTTEFTGVFNQYNFALTAEALAKLPGALATGPYERAFSDFPRALKAGAFAHGGGMARVSLENTHARPMTISNMRVVNIVRECIPLAAAILHGNEGGDAIPMSFNLDAAAPVAHDMAGADPARPYFAVHTLDLKPGEKQVLTLNFEVVRHAYSFDVAIDYEVAGATYVRLLRNGGVPFRAASSLCPAPDQRGGLAPADVARLRGLRYEHVLTREPDENGYWRIVSVPPEQHARSCPTW
ncbi:MAG TPA: hypothetical protein VES42_04340 [Pilimelia sp.]|nr:hypothetical protein [Pilimelia sp.]